MHRFDAAKAIAAPWGKQVPLQYNHKDVLLYNVGVGCEDLQFVYEGHPQFAALPTFPVRFGHLGVVVDGFILVVGPLNVHAEQYVEMVRPLPPHGGKVSAQSRVTGLHHKASSAVVTLENHYTDEHGNLLAKTATTSFLRGVDKLGDIAPFEGAGTAPQKVSTPKRSPDLVEELFIPSNAAHLYRLASGDMNPLHVDPEAAKFAGFDQVILHGLCTFGYVVKTLIRRFCNNDVQRFRRVKVRFSAPVFLNESLVLEIWQDGPGRAVFQVRARDRAAVVLNNAYFEFSESRL